MKRLATALFGLIIASLICGIAIAQPPSQAAVGGEEQSSAGPARHDPMTGEGMGMCRMGRGGMPGMMGMMPLMMQTMQQDPKLRGRMMELHGEMMRTMGEAMIKRGKELQSAK